MTVPVAAELATLASWDPVALGGVVSGLETVDDGLRMCRGSLGEVLRRLETEEVWSGPAAREVVRHLLELSEVAAAVQTAWGGSLAALRPLVGRAASASELAAAALVTARVSGTDVDSVSRDGRRTAEAVARLVPETLVAPDGLAGLVAEALAEADAAADLARQAGEALAHLAPVPVPVDRGELAAWPAGPADLVPPQPGAGPAEVALWWLALSAGAQLAAIGRSPGAVGALDGLPAWARDRANRLLVERARADPGLTREEERTVAAVEFLLAREEAQGRTVQVYTFDLRRGLVTLSLGDLDRADAVAVLVPGIGNTSDDDLPALAGDAGALATAVRAAAPGISVATMVWLGYRTPTWGSIAVRGAAARGGVALDATLDGLAATRAAHGRKAPTTTVVAHSYGTVVVDEAADAPGALAADAVVLLGSPGMEEDAASLEVAQVRHAASVCDPISWLGWFGPSPWESRYGSDGLPTALCTGHSDYYDPGRPTLPAIAGVVAGPRAG